MTETVQYTHDSNAALLVRPQADTTFSYARPEFSLQRRAIIRSVEMLTGQPKLERLYRDWVENPPAEETIFAAAMRLLRIDLNTDFSAWRKLPRSGPLLIVANHPYGVLDGLTLGYLSTLVRTDVKILTHSLLTTVPDVRKFTLPVDFGGTDAARRTSARTRREAVDWLRAGHVIVIFPAGGVSTSVRPLSPHAVDNAWHPFVRKLASVEGVAIYPVFFAGQNSRLFQIASHYSYSMRLALLFRETVRRIGTTLEVKLGAPVASQDISTMPGDADFASKLRTHTYALGEGTGPDPREVFVFPPRMKFL
jgi:putative hemolysin